MWLFNTKKSDNSLKGCDEQKDKDAAQPVPQELACFKGQIRQRFGINNTDKNAKTKPGPSNDAKRE
jgi:hypothetical protein